MSLLMQRSISVPPIGRDICDLLYHTAVDIFLNPFCFTDTYKYKAYSMSPYPATTADSSIERIFFFASSFSTI